MEAEPTAHSPDDASVIQSVIQGQRNAFETLVARYADKVYAVAWCRLGDPDLAEEVVQETFIQAYQQLNCLKDPGKLLSWLTTIARNRSINLGMRFRNELKKRQRWAVDQAIQRDTQSAEEPSPAVMPATLQETLASMSTTHRECLSLFYLQGKNVQEAAAASGVSAGTFKTRLHRARAALRAQLETRLETELSRLKASEESRRSIMAAVMVQAPGSAGLPWLVGSFLSSIPVFSWVLMGVQIIAMLPGFLAARWLMKKDLTNLKDPTGYRAKLHEETTRRGLRRAVLFMPLIFLLFLTFQGWDQYGAIAVADFIGILFTFHFLTRLAVTKHTVTWPVFLVLAATLFFANGMVLLDWSAKPLMIINGFLFLAVAKFTRRHGIRMDQSVFLRLAHADLDDSTTDGPDGNTNTLQMQEFKEFLGYLASRQGVLSFDKDRSGLKVYLHPVKQRVGLMFAPFLPFRFPGGSWVRFAFNGRVAARLGKADQNDLAEMGVLSQNDTAVQDLEAKVTSAMKFAYTAWGNNSIEACASHLGYEDDPRIYHQRPESAFATRSIAFWQTLAGLILIFAGANGTWQESFGLPREMERMPPVAITPDDVNAFFDRVSEVESDTDAARETLRTWFLFGVKFPSQGDITPAAWLSVSNLFHQQFSLDHIQARFSDPSPRDPLYGMTYFSLGTKLPWFEWVDTTILQSRDWEERLQDLSPDTYQMSGFPYRSRTKADLVVDPTKDYFHYDLGSYRIKMEQISRMAEMDDLDFSTTIRTVANLQYLQAGQNAGMFAAEHLSELHGLFLNNGGGPILETWQALRLLKLLGGLDAIDREACVNGLKRLYRRKGVFYLRTNHPSLFIRGTAQTTYMAFDSLRILEALDAFPDLEHWEFRTPFTRQRGSNGGETTTYSWEELEAYFMKREFDRFIAKQRP